MNTSESKTDMVNHPPHYQSCSLECIDMMRAIFGDRAVTDYCALNAFKYLWRHDLKGKPDEDLKKADWYIKRAQMYNSMWRSLYLDHSTLASMQSMIEFWQYVLSPDEPDLPDLKIPEDLKAKETYKHSSTDGLKTCPYCGHNWNMTWDRRKDFDKSKLKIKCNNCGGIFKVLEFDKEKWEYIYDVDKKTNNEETIDWQNVLDVVKELHHSIFVNGCISIDDVFNNLNRIEEIAGKYLNKEVVD